MPIDAHNLQRTKELILSFIKARGPSLPVHIARDVKTSPLFASAFLSELFNERKLRMSHMKVGSTSLYLLPGQESQLENFVQYLNHKEQEAVHILKNSLSLEDEQIPPAIRVALRELKDFAIPSKQNINGQEKIVWKYAFAPKEPPINIPSQEIQTIQQIQNPAIPNSILQATMPKIESIQENNQAQQPSPSTTKEEKKKKPLPKKEKTPLQFSIAETTPINEETPFGKNVRKHLQEKSLEIFKIEEETKKSFSAIALIDSHFGKQSFFCIAKDKKKINEQDIQQALQKVQSHKMPVLLLIPSIPDKKTLSTIEPWKNIIKIDKLKI